MNTHGSDVFVDDLADDNGSSCEEENKSSNEENTIVNKKRTMNVVVITAADFQNAEFTTVDECYEMYVQYARCVGFGVRKGDVHRDDYGNLTSRRFFCNRAGKRDARYHGRMNRKREHKPETRTNCEAKVTVYRDKGSGSWKVRKLVEEHNHELTPLTFIHSIPNRRQIKDSDKAQIDSKHKSGIATSQITGFLAGQVGVGFSMKDLYNYIDKNRRAKIVDGDANATISYLEGKADSEPMAVAKYSLTDDNRLGNLFWADGLSRVDYQYFGDVVAFDSTCKKNKYNKPLFILSGTNHNRQTCIFGFALLEDECAGTYKWLLENFLEVMMGKAPSVLVTDGDRAINDAIKVTFPNATHRLCAWHLQKNATSNIKSQGFCEAFKSCIYANCDIDDFEKSWHEIVERFELQDNEWVKKVYEMKEMWATAYLRDKFCAGFITTSICEGINSFIKRFLKSRHNILELVQNLERAVWVYRNNELDAQFKSINGEPVVMTGLDPIERSAANVYTREIFKDVLKQIDGAGAVFVTSCENVGATVVYKVARYGKPNHEYTVLKDMNLYKYECTCNMWNGYGIPCSHLFCVMKYEHVTELPPSLILRRWCKDAKSYEEVSNVGEEDSDKAFLLRYGALSAASRWMSYLGARKLPYFRHTMEGISRISSGLEHKCGLAHGGEPVENDEKIDDPVVAKTNGAPTAMKDRSKKRLCSSCLLVGHTKRTCPKLICGKSPFDEDDYDLPSGSYDDLDSNDGANLEGHEDVAESGRSKTDLNACEDTSTGPTEGYLRHEFNNVQCNQ